MVKLILFVKCTDLSWSEYYEVFIDPAAGHGTDRYRSVDFVVRMRDARIINMARH